MPWHFTLFEFYDPIYEKIDDPSTQLSRPTEWTEETRRYMSDLQDAERSILSPLYKGKARHWQEQALALLPKSAIYRILDHKPLDLLRMAEAIPMAGRRQQRFEYAGDSGRERRTIPWSRYWTNGQTGCRPWALPHV